MRKQSTVFASLFLSLVAGMAASETVSYLFDQAALREARVSNQQSPAEVAGVALRLEAVN